MSSVSHPWLCEEFGLSTVSPCVCVCACVCGTQAPTHVVFTTAAAAACASPSQGAGSAPVLKTKYWTLPTTPAAKVGGRMLPACVRAYVCVCLCLHSYFCEHQFGAIWVCRPAEGGELFFSFSAPHIFFRLPEGPFSGSKPVFCAQIGVWIWFDWGFVVGEGWGLAEVLRNAFCQWMSTQK